MILGSRKIPKHSHPQSFSNNLRALKEPTLLEFSHQVPKNSQGEFELIRFYEEAEFAGYVKRARSEKYGRPRVKIWRNDEGHPMVYVEKSQTYLFSHLQKLSFQLRLYKVMDILSIIKGLVGEYGYFYLYKEMMRVNKKGETLVWIHENFGINHREFSIRDSSFSELIFVKKLKMTFSELINFDDSEVSTLKQLQTYLKAKFQHKIKESRNQNYSYNHFFDIFDNHTKQPFRLFPKIPISSPGSPSHSKQLKENNNESEDSWKKSAGTEKRWESPFRKLENSQSSSSLLVSQKNESNSHLDVSEKYCYSQVSVGKMRKVEVRNRKQSADVTTISNWLKSSSKNLDKKFSNSSFSTRITFTNMESSLHEVDDKKEDAEPKKHYFKNYSENKKKTKENGMNVVQQTIELEVENLFEEEEVGYKLSLGHIPSTKSSEIEKQLNTLFQSSEYINIEEESENKEVERDFEAILLN